MSEENSILPFKIDIPQPRLDWIRDRVRDYPWPSRASRGWSEGWEYGTSLSALRDLCQYWFESYDWREAELGINRYSQFLGRVDDQDVHFIMEKGSGANPKPLLLLHGWPGSFYEFLDHIEPLAHPERFGGSVDDAFTVIVPSLPGYGFSPSPLKPTGPRGIARIMAALMQDVLGFDRYLIQGGDWGALIGGWMAYEASGCEALHINLMGWDSPGVVPETDEERAYAAKVAAIGDDGLGYAHQQRTRPQTLSIAMRDSPVGVCAWILEKFYAWSDTRDGFDRVYSPVQLLTNIMIYLVTDSFNSAAWAYKGRQIERPYPAPAGARIEVPTAIANFPMEFLPFPPRSFVERSVNVVRWTDFEKGGHFPALERPIELRADLQAFARQLREAL